MIEQLRRFAAGLSYEDLPAPVSERVRLGVVDSLCTAVAGSGRGEGSEAALHAARAAGSDGEVPAFGLGVRLDPLWASFVNGVTSHNLNFDMVGPYGSHVGVVTLAAPMAAAFQRGGVSGRDYLSAVAAGAEVMARIAAGAREHVTGDAHQHVLEGQVLGYFGAAVAAGRVLGLDEDGLGDALGLALMQAAGTMEVVHGGDVPAKAAYGGFSNMGGLLAALLARGGLGASMDVLGGRSALYAYYYGHDGATYETVTAGLGERFLLMDARYKLWPTSGLLHPYIEAVVRWRADGVDAGAVERMRVRVPEWLRPWVEPEDVRRRPPNGAAAGNSMQFVLAKALVHGTVRLADLGDDGLADAVSLDTAARIDHEIVPEGEDGSVAIRTTDGQEVELAPATPRGNPEVPLDPADVEAKLLDCLSHGVEPLDAGQARAVVEAGMRLEELDDVRELGELAHGSA